MARPYSNDLRERVVGSVERVPEAGARKAVSYYSVRVSALLLTRRPEVDLMLHHLQANHSHRHAGRGA